MQLPNIHALSPSTVNTDLLIMDLTTQYVICVACTSENNKHEKATGENVFFFIIYRRLARTK